MWINERVELNLILVWELQVLGHGVEEFGDGLEVLFFN